MKNNCEVPTMKRALPLIKTAAGLTLLVLACAPPHSTGTDPTDVGLATGKKTRMEKLCGFPAPTVPSATPDEAVKQAWSALPPSFQTLFPLSSYKLVGTEELAKSCVLPDSLKAGAGSKIAPDLHGCWRVLVTKKDNNTTVQTPEILILNEVRAVHDTLVSMTGYAFVEFYVDILFKNAKEGSAEASLYKQMVDLRSKFMTAYLGDANGTGGDLPPDKAAELKACFNNLPTEALANFLFAESFDSFYCSKDTYAAFDNAGVDNNGNPIKLLKAKQVAYDGFRVVSPQAWDGK